MTRPVSHTQLVQPPEDILRRVVVALELRSVGARTRDGDNRYSGRSVGEVKG